MSELSNGFMDLKQDELYDIDGGNPLVVGAVIIICVCAVVFVASVAVAAVNAYCEMEAAAGA